MNQPYFVLEFAHSIHGRFQQIRFSHRSLKYVLCSLLLLVLLAGAGVFAFVRMSWRASRLEQLQADLDHLRTRYQELQRVSTQRKEEMASLANLATEVTQEYGITRPENGGAGEPAALDSDTSSSPDYKESLEQFNFLKSASYASLYNRYAYHWQTHNQPSAWPVEGALRSSFGGRTDPFSGEGAFHTGIDLSAKTGTAVHVTADGVVVRTDWSGRYGRLVVVDHGNGFQTYYAHLSKFMVVPGEEVRLGEIVALSGGTGRVTSPHLHYEVRIKGAPVNPYRFLTPRTQMVQMSKPTQISKAHNDLGL